MRRVVLSIGVVAAIATAGIAAAVASDGRGSKVLELTAVQVSASEVSTEGFVGTRFVGVDELMTAGRPVGRGVRSCEVVAAGREDSATFQCLFTLSLQRGTVTLQAMPTLTDAGLEDGKAAVTGGTGDFRHARREALIQELSRTETRYAIDLR